MGSSVILLRAAFCIAANLTTNEGIVNVRYAYLQGPDGRFWNYFDRGVLSNCLQFWLSRTPRPDWALIYQTEVQVGSSSANFDHKVAIFLCCKSILFFGIVKLGAKG